MALPEDMVAKVRQDFGEEDGLLVLHELNETEGGCDTGVANWSEPRPFIYARLYT
jgi:hypothetical protein